MRARARVDRRGWVSRSGTCTAATVLCTHAQVGVGARTGRGCARVHPAGGKGAHLIRGSGRSFPRSTPRHPQPRPRPALSATPATCAAPAASATAAHEQARAPGGAARPARAAGTRAARGARARSGGRHRARCCGGPGGVAARAGLAGGRGKRSVRGRCGSAGRGGQAPAPLTTTKKKKRPTRCFPVLYFRISYNVTTGVITCNLSCACAVRHTVRARARAQAPRVPPGGGRTGEGGVPDARAWADGGDADGRAGNARAARAPMPTRPRVATRRAMAAARPRARGGAAEVGEGSGRRWCGVRRRCGLPSRGLAGERVGRCARRRRRGHQQFGGGGCCGADVRAPRTLWTLSRVMEGAGGWCSGTPDVLFLLGLESLPAPPGARVRVGNIDQVFVKMTLPLAPALYNEASCRRCSGAAARAHRLFRRALGRRLTLRFLGRQSPTWCPHPYWTRCWHRRYPRMGSLGAIAAIGEKGLAVPLLAPKTPGGALYPF